MTASQRACQAALDIDGFTEGPLRRMRAGRPVKGLEQCGTTADLAGAAYSVSGTLVSSALRLHRGRPDLFQRALDGELSVHVAVGLLAEGTSAAVKCLYLMQAGDTGPVKIGVTVGSVDKRRTELQTGCPWKITVLATFPGHHRQAERALHAKYADQRMEGEWFALSTTDIQDIIQRLT